MTSILTLLKKGEVITLNKDLSLFMLISKKNNNARTFFYLFKKTDTNRYYRPKDMKNILTKKEALNLMARNNIDLSNISQI